MASGGGDIVDEEVEEVGEGEKGVVEDAASRSASE